MDAAAALAALGSSPDGLRSAEAAARLARTGSNELPAKGGPSPARQVLEQMASFFALMLWVAAVLALVGGLPALAVAIVVVVVVNGLFSFAQEYRAERAVRALSALLPDKVTVRRSGRKVRVPAADLVPGDVVLLAEGDRISADGRVIESIGLAVDESTLTGESVPVPRMADQVPSPPSEALEAPNLVFAGTFVASGSGAAVIAATGGATRLGAISRLTGEIVRRPTPLRTELNHAVRLIAALAVTTGVLFFGVSLALGTPPRDGFLFSVGVIVALVPEGLLPTLSLSLAMSSTRMAHHGALVRRLESVETLGSTTVICTDKTGTITANEMTVRRVSAGAVRVSVTGTGYHSGGAFVADDRPLRENEQALLQPLLRAAALCTDAHVEEREGRWQCAGDPTEGAIVVVARKGGLERDELERRSPRIREFPFDASRRRMTTVHALPSGAFEVITKGSPEVILDICVDVAQDHGSIGLAPEVTVALQAEVERLAGQGFRVLAVARGEHPAMPATPEEAEQRLELLGFVGLEDPVRPEVPDAVARCRNAGIRVVMITGDHPATARSIAEKAGMSPDRVVLGQELPSGEDELCTMLGDPAVRVLARVAPEQKLRIAAAFQRLGEVVAMTGDGVNDAPALRRADIGVAMGVVGTDVAREAADIVLLDDNFAHIVEAVEEGRAAFDNIRRFLTYHLTDNVAELTPFLLWALTGGRIPLVLTVLQVLALDIGTDLLPALALGAEHPETGVMDRPPRSRQARLLDARVLGRAFGFLGPVEAIVSMSMLWIGAALFFGWSFGGELPGSGMPLAVLSTMVFAAIVTMQMANSLECRSTPASLWTIGPLGNRLLLGAIGLEAVALAVFVYVPPVATALRQHPLTAEQWLVVLPAPFLLLGAEEIRKAIVRRPGKPTRPKPRSTIP
jgi:magnesium-transporting ATPase (P-type)